jgi:hypothetical protein
MERKEVAMGKSLAIRATVAGFLLALTATSCVSSGVDSYEDFSSAVDSGATCAQLIDMRSNFDDRPRLQEKIDSDLEEIGCKSTSSERTDQ